MAKFEVELPDNIIKDIREIDSKADEIFGSMTKAGAEVVRNTMVSKAPPSIQPHIKISVTYKTPSDGGINNKVYISGYIPFKGGRTTFSRSGNGGRYTTTKGVPADFLAKVFEYGRRAYQGRQRRGYPYQHCPADYQARLRRVPDS